jgi:alpha-D-ribose 1-methylphosphonate 5-phosphate C-P lyase
MEAADAQEQGLRRGADGTEARGPAEGKQDTAAILSTADDILAGLDEIEVPNTTPSININTIFNITTEANTETNTNTNTTTNTNTITNTNLTLTL